MGILDIKKRLIYDAFEDNDGLLNFNQVKELGLSYYTLNLMLANAEIYSDERGLYSLPNVYVDEWFGIQHRFPKGIFSLDSALWLHGLSLTVPFQPTLSFPYGTNTKNIKQNNILPIVLRSYYDIGIEQLERQPKQNIFVYSRERTLAECLRPIYKMDIQLISTAFQIYFNNGQYNLDELYYYGKLFKVTRKLQSYIEVLT
ncbi:transcriptional regulator [uncultured Veillonella sp.]|uniref:type IV toxin-antitoxin system AbiEi family antitoxin domain-containing protein n=1 Tax=uncultured Veillonella sp. TaxID=159268 RepID=UPI0025E32CA1|nr:transcriptional regulator [uncultured Veillonella sp.]